MDIFIPAELTGATQYAAGMEMSKAIQSFADVSRQTVENVNNTNAYIEALEHENKMTKIYDGATEEIRGLDYDELKKRKAAGTDPYTLANTRATDYLNTISNIKTKQYAAQKMSYIQYKMDQKTQALEEHKRITAGQMVLDENMKDVAERASSYMYDPNIRPDDEQLRNAEKQKAEGKDPSWVNDANILNSIEESKHWDRNILEMQGKIAGAVTAGIISYQQAQVMDSQARINVALAIARNNPGKANEFFNQQAADMEPLDFERGKQALQAFIKEKGTTDAVQSLQDEFRLNDPDGDWSGATKKIFDHKNWDSYGISTAEDAIKIMGMLTHSVQSMVQTQKLQEQHQINSIWETQVAPLLKKGNISQIYKNIDSASISETAKAEARHDAKRYMDAMKRGSGGTGGVGKDNLFDPGELPDSILKDKKLFGYTLTEISKLETRVKPDQVMNAYDTAMENLRELAKKKEADGGKVVWKDIWSTFTNVMTDPKFLKKSKQSLRDSMPGGKPTVVTPRTADGKVDKTPIRIPGESVDAFNSRTGVRRAFGVDVSDSPYHFGR